MHFITVDAEVLKGFADEQTKSMYNQRFKVTVNDEITWQAGTTSLGNGNAYISFSAARMKKIGVRLGDKVSVLLEKDDSEFGFDVPIELQEVLSQDAHAQARFQLLSKGFQRYIIYQVAHYKSSDKRIEKSIFFLENLKRSPENETTMRHVLGKDLP